MESAYLQGILLQYTPWERKKKKTTANIFPLVCLPSLSHSWKPQMQNSGVTSSPTYLSWICVGFSQRALVLQTFWNLCPYQDMHLQYIKHPRPFTEKVWAVFWAPVNYTFHHKYSVWFDPNHPWKACPWWKEKNIPMKNYFLLEHTWELSSTQNYSKEGRKARMQETILANLKKKRLKSNLHFLYLPKTSWKICIVHH